MNTYNYLQINDTIFAMCETPIKETEKAIEVRVVNMSCTSNRTFWFPKSQITKKDGKFIIPIWALDKLNVLR